MKPFAFVLLPVVCISMMGCSPDPAVKRGEVIDEGPSTAHKDIKPSKPLTIEPKTDKESPVKQVQ